MALGGVLGPGLVARDARGAAPLLRGRRGTWWHPLWFHVAGVALGDIHLRFTRQAWHNLTSTVVLRGRRLIHGTGWRPWARFSRAWRPWRSATSAWQAWPLVTSTFVWGALGPGFVARDVAAVCVAGVALGDIHFRFTWQVWHLVTSTLVLRGRRGTISHPTSFCVAGVAPSLTHLLSHTTLSHTIVHTPSFTPNFVKHHLWHTIFHTLLCHTPLCHTPSFTTPSSTHHLSPPHFSHTTLSHTIFDTPSFTHHFVTHRLSHTTLSHALFHTELSPTPSFTTPSFTHHFVTHHLLPHHHLSHTTLSHTIFHTQLCHTLSFTHNFHTHHLSHTALSHTRTLSFFVTHHLSHSTLSLTTVLTSRSFTASFPLPSFPVPATTFHAYYWKKLTCGVIRSFNFTMTMIIMGLKINDAMLARNCCCYQPEWWETAFALGRFNTKHTMKPVYRNYSTRPISFVHITAHKTSHRYIPEHNSPHESIFPNLHIFVMFS